MTVIQSLPTNISYFQINKVFLDPVELWLNIELINPIEITEKVELKLYEVAYFSISKTPEDSEGYYLVGNIQLSLWDDVTSLYKKLNYEFSNICTDSDFYYLHIEGDICLNVVSKSCVVNHTICR